MANTDACNQELLRGYIRKITLAEPAESSFLEDRVNHILLFFGAFNPPHRGHLDFLKHSFENVGTDVHLACAFMIPRSESYVRDVKFKEGRNPLILPSVLRSTLCSSDERWPPWGTAFGEEKSSRALRDLKEFAKSLGFRI